LIQRAKLIFLLFLIPTLSYGQQDYQGNLIFDRGTDEQRTFILDGALEYQSTGVNMDFVNAFLFNKVIDNDLKDQVSGNLTTLNRFGFQWQGGIAVEQLADTLLGGRGKWMIGLQNRNLAGIRFPKDVFDLAFYGNAGFAGQEASLKDIQFDQYRFNQLYFGFERIWEKESQPTFVGGMAFSLYQGVSHTHLEFGRGSLYTEELGQYLDLDMQMELNATDTNNTSAFSINGIGAGLDLHLELRSKVTFSLDVSDLGIISWNNRSVFYKQDTSFRFNGYEATNILDLENGLPDIANEDSLMELANIDRGINAYDTWLPLMVSATLATEIGSKFHVVARASFRQEISRAPLIHVKATYFTGGVGNTTNTGFSLINRFGGWGGYGFGAEFSRSASADWGHMQISVGSNGLQGFIFPKGLPGSSLYLRFVAGL
jgi:hypothetical protein